MCFSKILFHKWVLLIHLPVRFSNICKKLIKEKYRFSSVISRPCLGDWLAQITNFTTKYLKTEENTFLKIDNIPQSYRPHIAVFDSPVCKDILLQMTDKLDVWPDGRSIDIEQLDITSYLSTPNRFNSCNKHVVTVYRILTYLFVWTGSKSLLHSIT